MDGIIRPEVEQLREELRQERIDAHTRDAFYSERIAELEAWQKEARALLVEIGLYDHAGTDELYVLTRKSNNRDWTKRRDALLQEGE